MAGKNLPRSHTSSMALPRMALTGSIRRMEGKLSASGEEAARA